MAKPLKTEFAKKDGILHSAAFFLTIILMLLASYVIFSSSFVEFEKEKTLDNTHLALHTINDDLAFLSSSASYMASYAESVSMDANGIDIYNRIIKHLETDSVHDIDGVLIYDISSQV